MRRDIALTASCLIAFVGAASSFAQDTTLPTSQQTPVRVDPDAPEVVVEENLATIVTVTGKVQVGDSRTGPWTDAKVGMALNEGQWVRTGVNSLVNIRVGQEQIFSGTGIALISIDRMRKAVDQANQARTDETDIRLEYGRLLFNVTSTAHANDVEIQAPDATLAIKGTSGGMEVIANRTSAAFGGEMNRGLFTVTYADGTVASINDDSRSSSASPDPARNTARNARVLTGAKYAREQEEDAVVERSPGGGDAVNALGNEGAGNTSPFNFNFFVDPTPPPPPPPHFPPHLDKTIMYMIDPPAFQLRGRNINNGNEGVIINTLPRNGTGNPDAGRFIEAGLGLRAADAGNELLYFFGGIDDNGEIEAVNELFTLSLPPGQTTPAPGTEWQLLNTYADAPLIAGIDTLDSNIYGVTRQHNLDNFHSRLVSITTGANGAVTDLVDFRIPLDGAIAGANSRGTLFLASSGVFSSGFFSYEGSEFSSLFNSLFLEIDPRNTYLANSWFGFNGLNDLTGTTLGPGVSITSDFALSRFTGAAFVNGSVIYSAFANVDNDAGLESIFIHINPNFSIDDGGPFITKIELASGNLNALAGVDLASIAPSTALIPTDASVLQAARIDPLIGRLAYSYEAWSSGFVYLLALDAFAELAPNPEECLQDSEAIAQLSINLFNNVGHQYGIANAIAQTLAMLMPGSFCGCGMHGGGDVDHPIPVLAGLQGIDTLAGKAVEISLAPPNTAAVDNLPSYHIDGGYAARNASGSMVELLYLDGGNAYDAGNGIAQYNNLYARTFSATAGISSGFELIANFDTGTGDGTPGAVLTGLAALNNTIYATRHQYNNLESALVRLNTANSTITTLAEFPGASVQALAGAPDIGALYVAGLYSAANPNPGAQYHNLFLMSIDPRTTTAGNQPSPLILDTYWGNNADFSINSATALGQGFSPGTFDQVERISGLGYDGHFLQLGAFANAQGAHGQDAFFITYHPDATNSQLDPYVTAMDVAFSAGIAGLTSAAEAAASNVTYNIIDPQDGKVDMVTINSFFARLSYTPDALESGLIQGIFTEHFVNTADDPVNCANSAVIAMIPDALADNANKANGIGRTTYQLRNVLPHGHACAVSNFHSQNQ